MSKSIKKIFTIMFILLMCLYWIPLNRTYAATEDMGPFEHSIIGARVWSTYNGSLNMREDCTGSAKLIAQLPQGQKMQVIGGIKNNYVKVKTEYKGNTYTGYVYIKYLMINLPDIMPSLEYYIANADYSWYTCERYNIPNVTGEVLYPNAKYTVRPVGYVTYTRTDPNTQRICTFYKYFVTNEVTKYYVPLRYDAALKLNKAYQAAKADGYNIKIYDSYRPYSVTKKIYNEFSAVANANDERGQNMRNAMNKNGLGITWFLAAGKSAHNYGIALDLTLTKDGKEIQAQTKMHQLDASAAVANNNAETNRLQKYMTSAGFSTLKSEWWHFQDGSTSAQYVSGNYCDFQVE